MPLAAMVGCAVAILAWGSAGVFDKLAVKGGDVLAAVLVRMVLGTAAVFVVCVATGRLKAVAELDPRAWWFLAGSAVMGGVLGQVAYFVAIKHAPVSAVVPITASYPVVALIGAALVLREAPSPTRMVGVTLVVIGVALVSAGGPRRAAQARPGGDAVQVTVSGGLEGPGRAPAPDEGSKDGT